MQRWYSLPDGPWEDAMTDIFEVTTTDGVKLHVESTGQGQPIIFVAGYMATLASWSCQVDAAAAAGYRAVAFDRRWHGLSDKPAHGQRIARHAADLREVILALGLEKPLLVGGSMGASVCWSYIDLFGSPAIAGMIGVDQTPRMINGPDWDYGFYGLTQDNVGRFFADGVPETGRGRSIEAFIAAVAVLQAKVGTARLGDVPTPDTLPLLNDHARQDWRDICATTTSPMLLIAGRDSQLWPAQHILAIAGNPNGQSLIIDDCGHAVNVEQPEAFNKALLKFAAMCG
jgi:non-heme chloroperoxidase